MTTQLTATMAENDLHPKMQIGGTATRQRGVCDKWLVGLVFVTLVRTGEALASEQSALPGAAAKPDFNTYSNERTSVTEPTLATFPRSTLPAAASGISASRTSGSPFMSTPLTALPASYQALDLPEDKSFSTRDFLPRRRSILEPEHVIDSEEYAPLVSGPTIWQRMAEYRSQGRIRLLTLWETGGSSMSLQAGRKGEPSLQWTSRLMNRGAAAHGVLDQLFSTSVAGASRGLHWLPRAANPDPPAKAAKLVDAGAAALK